MKNTGFTLVEMLVVIGIIAVLTAASVVGYSRVTASAEKAKCTELVKNVHTALVQVYNNNNGAWPRALINGQSRGILDETASLPIADMLGLRKDSAGNLTGYDKFGIVTPWATQVIKSGGSSATTSTKVPTGGTIESHTLRYAIDTEGEGIIQSGQISGLSVGGNGVRETALVWCCGRDGVIEGDFNRGSRKDDVYSWRPGDIVQ